MFAKQPTRQRTRHEKMCFAVMAMVPLYAFVLVLGQYIAPETLNDWLDQTASAADTLRYFIPAIDRYSDLLFRNGKSESVALFRHVLAIGWISAAILLVMFSWDLRQFRQDILDLAALYEARAIDKWRFAFLCAAIIPFPFYAVYAGLDSITMAKFFLRAPYFIPLATQAAALFPAIALAFAWPWFQKILAGAGGGTR